MNRKHCLLLVSALLPLSWAAMADIVHWESGEVWQDAFVEEMLIDNEGPKFRIRDAEGKVGWWTGVRRVEREGNVADATYPEAANEEELRLLRQQRVPMMIVLGRPYYRVGNEYYNEERLRRAITTEEQHRTTVQRRRLQESVERAQPPAAGPVMQPLLEESQQPEPEAVEPQEDEIEQGWQGAGWE